MAFSFLLRVTPRMKNDSENILLVHWREKKARGSRFCDFNFSFGFPFDRYLLYRESLSYISPPVRLCIIARRWLSNETANVVWLTIKALVVNYCRSYTCKSSFVAPRMFTRVFTLRVGYWISMNVTRSNGNQVNTIALRN